MLIYCKYLEKMSLECSSGVEVMFHFQFQHAHFLFFYFMPINLVEIRIPKTFSVCICKIQTEICPYDPQIFNFHFSDTPQTCKIILANHHQSFVRKYYFFAFVQISSFSYVQFKGCTLYYCSSSTLPVYNHRRLTDVTIYKYIYLRYLRTRVRIYL
jgi:hypothetical protein